VVESLLYVRCAKQSFEWDINRLPKAARLAVNFCRGQAMGNKVLKELITPHRLSVTA